MNSQHNRVNFYFLAVALVACVFLTPAFQFTGNLGFHTVEWGFFIVSPIFILVLLYRISKVSYKVNKLGVLLAIFVLLLYLSLIDAKNPVKGILYSTQFVLYLALFSTITVFIREEYYCEKLIQVLVAISVVICLIVIILNLYYGSRAQLNLRLVDLFALPVNKVFTFIEFPFLYLLIKCYMGRVTKIELLCFLVLLTAVLSTASRGSYLVLVASAILGVIITKKYNRGSLVFIGLIGVFLILFFSEPFAHVRERILKLVPTGTIQVENKIESYSRLYTAQVALELMVKNPINGVGMGNISQNSQDVAYGLDIPIEIINYWERRAFYETTNSFLKLGAELGVTGFILIILFYYLLWRRSLKVENRLLKNVCVIYLCISFIHNLVDLGFYNYYSWINFAIIYSLSFAYKDNNAVLKHV